MLRVSLSIIALLASGSIASSQTYLGAGGASCAEYVSLLEESSTRKLMDSYLQGYVSGVNFMIYVVMKSDPLAPESPRDVTAYVKAYCRQNPSKTLLNAANDYLHALR
jgi:hypothetical protein